MGDKVLELSVLFLFLFFPLHALLRFLGFITDGQDFHYSYCPSLWNICSLPYIHLPFHSLSLSRMVMVFEEAHCVSLWVLMRARQQIQSASYGKVFRHFDYGQPSTIFLFAHISWYL